MAEAKRLFNQGLIAEALTHYEEAVEKDEVKSDRVVKALVSVAHARMLIELELFPKA